MSDTKRNSLGGARANPPKPARGPSATGPGELDYSQVIGARCKVTTASTPALTAEGNIFTVCPVTNILAIGTSTIANATGSKAADYKLIPIPRIQSFTLLPKTSKPPSTGSAAAASTATPPSASAVFEQAQPAIARIDFKALQAREAAGIRKVRERDAARGKGVTKEAQDIFNALLRTLPTRWDGQNIIVNDAVNISPPYTSGDCRAPKSQQAALERVKMVLENVRMKLASRQQQGEKPLAAAATKTAETRPAGAARTAIATPAMVATPLPRKGG